MSGSPLVTVGILSHRANFLPAALQSVFDQTEQDFQIVVQHCKNNWATKANEMCSIAQGEFIVLLCDDDLLHPKFLAECLQRAQHADMIYTDRVCFTHVERKWFDPRTWRGTQPTKGVRVRQLGDHYTEKTSGPKGYFTTQFPPDIFKFGSTLPMTCMIRRSWWQQLGGYDPQMPHADTEFWLRSAAAEAPKCRFVYIPQPLFQYRQHPEQYSKTYKNSLHDAMLAYHNKHFRRFGVIWEGARHIEGDKWEVLYVPPEERERVLMYAHEAQSQGIL